MFYQSLGKTAKKHSLYTGVAIVFEQEDAAGALDFLTFMDTYEQSHKKEKEEYLVPFIFHVDEDPIDPDELLEVLRKHAVTPEGVLPDDVVVQFDNEHRMAFLGYMDHLHTTLTKRTVGNVVDNEHELYPTYKFLLDIQRRFFPPVKKLN